jgi:hypothetical protein
VLRFFSSIAAAAGILLVASGCSSSGRRSSFHAPSSGELIELNVLTAPVGLDLDGRPGIDGFSVRVFGNITANPKPVPIVSGTLEIVMFDGTVYGRTNVPPPLHIWTFAADQLRNYEFKARIGTGYEFALPWGTNVPTRNLISIGARYTSPEGRILTSSLSSVTVLNK